MKQVQLTSHRLTDSIVKDAILAVNTLENERDIKLRIGGGMAVQSYINSDLHRKTIDLDYTMPWQGNTTEYKKFVQPLLDYLSDKNYDFGVKKKSRSYDIIFGRENGKKDSFMIQHPNYSKKFFNKIQSSVEREIENRRTITKKNFSYHVLSPEDVVATKLHRILLFSKKYNLWAPENASTKELRGISQNLRQDVLSRFPEVSPADVAKLRLVNDCYDVRSLSENVGLNSAYFGEVCNEWRDTNICANDFSGLLRKLGIDAD